MHDMYPGDRPSHGAAKVNAFIYEKISEVLRARDQGEKIDDPGSWVAQTVDGRVAAIREIGVEQGRIATVAAIAHIDISGQRDRFVAPGAGEVYG